MDYKNGDHIWISTSGRSRQAKFIRYHGEQCIVEMTVRVTTSLYIIHRRQIIGYDKTKQPLFCRKFIKKVML